MDQRRLPSGAILLEWLLAIASGVFLSVLMIKLYQNLLLQDSLHQTQFDTLSQLVVAEQLLSHKLHLTTAWPCGDTPQKINLLNKTKQFRWLDIANTHKVYPHNSAAALALKAYGKQAGDRVPGSDVVFVLNARFPVRIKHHHTKDKTFELTAAAAVQRGAFAVICDAEVSALFQVTSVRAHGHILSYQNKRVSPGNCAKAFSLSHSCSKRNAHVFSNDALFAVLRPVIFYVGHSHSKGQRALFQRNLVLVNRAGGKVQAQMLAEELVQGIALLRGRSLASHILDLGLISGSRGSNHKLFNQNTLTLFGEDVASWLQPDRFYVLAEFTFVT